MTLSVELIGPDVYTVSLDVDTADGAAAKTLWMRANNSSYGNMAQVQINDAPWISLNSQTADVKSAAIAYGGIGGGYDSLELTAAFSSMRAGRNTIRFCFSATDGVSTGYRILTSNVLDQSGRALIADSALAKDDPVVWRPPRSAANDIAVGES